MKVSLSIVCILALAAQPTFADGFSLDRAFEKEGPVQLDLTKDQLVQVGIFRRLDLTSKQKIKLRQFVKNVPDTLGVESLREPDCSCCISSAMWTNTNVVTVWTKRLSYDENGSKFYYECRMRPGHYTMDASGQIYSAGELVTWKAFVSDVRQRVRSNTPRHLSLPPVVPPASQKLLDSLPDDIDPSGRL